MAAVLAAGVLLPWLVRRPVLAKLRRAAPPAALTVLAAIPQLPAMAGQALTGGAALSTPVPPPLGPAGPGPPPPVVAPAPG